MKLSMFQVIAIVCILAVSFLTVTPFLPKTDADCNYFSESMCEGAAEYASERLIYAVYTCWMGGTDCAQSMQTAANAMQWAAWVCEHADS